MTELELRKINYTEGGNNYVARGEAENHWVGFAQSVVNILIESYGDNFNFIIYWHNKHNEVEFISIPYLDIKHLLHEEFLSSNPSKWHFVIRDNELQLRGNSNYAIDISKYSNIYSKEDVASFDQSYSASEGDRKLRLHYEIERSQSLVKAFKRYKKTINETLKCEICGFSFCETYGVLGKGFIEVHHIEPISQRKQSKETTFKDLILVCSNCHQMLHRKLYSKEYLSIEELRQIVKR